MKKRFPLLIAMVLLLGLLPAVALAAPPKPPYVSVGDWTLPVELGDPAPIAQLSAWNIDWRVPNAARVELGYTYRNEDGITVEVVEVSLPVTKDDRYPQNLDLAGKSYYMFAAGDCTLRQFVQIVGRTGEVVAVAESVAQEVCIDQMGD
jgi:hypothetical protein